MILFVQPFGLAAAGGGARIMRALLENAPTQWLSVAATSTPTQPPQFGQELQVSGRPYFGRLERTRLAVWFTRLDGWGGSRLEAKLNNIIQQHRVTAVHGIAHACWDSLAAYKAARQNRLPFFLTIHDDPAYCLRANPKREKLLAGVAECWRAAAARFVICEEMGEELCRRWGRQDYLLVTDGLSEMASQPRAPFPNRLALYFMGLLHNSYEPNFVALQQALHLISQQQPRLQVRLILRGASLRRKAIIHSQFLQELPFGSESQVQADLNEADILYQPLSLAPADWPMNAYSLSTKMITYLGAGLPILFHGPADSAAAKLLSRHHAAKVCGTNDPVQLAQSLQQLIGPEREQVVRSALQLAKQQFQSTAVRQKFWGAMNIDPRAGRFGISQFN